MRRIFHRKDRSKSTSSGSGAGPVSSSSLAVTNEVIGTSNNSRTRNRRYSLPEFHSEILHYSESGSSPRRSNGTRDESAIDDNGDLSPQTSVAESVALSETDTLYYDKKHRLELQETYNENFMLYLPFILRQMRSQANRMTSSSRNNYFGRDVIVNSPTDSTAVPGTRNNNTENEDHDVPELANSSRTVEDTIRAYDPDVIDDDVPTILNESIDLDPEVASNLILQKPTSKFNVKREFIIVTEFMKNSTYVFPSEASFNLFKELRNNVKKARQSSIITYDESGNIRRLSNIQREDVLKHQGTIIDDRPHIIPLDYKLKGTGLPIFKITVPYLSSFRKNAPYMVFRRYREVPLKPTTADNTPNPGDKDTDIENYETYPFCTVNSKHFQKVRRFILSFHLNGEAPDFKVVMFLNNFNPFADFTYKNTRFRVIGPSIPSGYIMVYNPHLRLLIVDDEKPSLCDDMVNRKSGFELSKMMKRKSTSKNGTTKSNGDILDPQKSPSSNGEMCKFDIDDPATYVNPYPNPKNPLIQDENFISLSAFTPHSNYISDRLPPFGAFKDSMIYLKQPVNILPKKYCEAGKFELYQDNVTEVLKDLNTTFSVDTDVLVLLCAVAVLRDVSIRNSTKTSQANLGLVSRLGVLGAASPASNLSSFGTFSPIM
ncbi:uncharacterized protein RJT20DRAFT_152050 [Scheffersomyces xylosifermentans]|uniref:uncharacterized protein n=1 Tax=Scheffersomyces xylosifermentans TaxID=1304137 RepID=UPI00315D3763